VVNAVELHPSSLPRVGESNASLQLCIPGIHVVRKTYDPTIRQVEQEVGVPVVAVFQGVTREQYEESIRKLTGGKNRVESPDDWPVDGLLAHIAGEGETGFRVVDVWESEHAFGRFGETLMPILQELGVQGRPEIYPAHTFVSS
jgi:hypothetical protein